MFLEAFRTERYTLAQGKFLNANMEYRISQRRIMEEYMEAFDMPTRSEIDEAHRRIYELRKEVKGLKKQLNELQAAGETAAKPAPSSKKRTSSPRKRWNMVLPPRKKSIARIMLCFTGTHRW